MLAVYESMSEAAKTYISDTDKAKITAWQEKYRILYDMSNIGAFSKENTKFAGYKFVKFTLGTDATYGNVLKAT